MANSDSIRDRILGDLSTRDRPNHLVANEAGTGGEPTYWPKADYPLYTLRCRNDPEGRPDGACPIEGKQIRIPTGSQREGGPSAPQGLDRHLTIVDQKLTDPGVPWEYDLWKAENPPPGGGDLYFGWGGRTRLDGDGLTERPQSGLSGNSTASHFGGLAGRVRAEELEGGLVPFRRFALRWLL